jgi:hypothetical protein
MNVGSISKEIIEVVAHTTVNCPASEPTAVRNFTARLQMIEKWGKFYD